MLEGRQGTDYPIGVIADQTGRLPQLSKVLREISINPELGSVYQPS
jgi:hypothetical protein